ncbi:bactericidal permeability-increasing protein-like [Haliotis rufescens]|uniref:bactericidal permeability-increasing protein-like n=1 Tax=Haliotis rufescens TaxID=6454 RepID=UPI00201F52B6|nr:bactericidal permeability-increasing protein-like [Haliotis rufescens]
MKIVVIFVVVVFVAVVASTAPGFKARITQKGLTYANKMAMLALSQSIRKLHIPDQSGKSGKVTYSITGMTIKSFTTPGSSMALGKGAGIKWSATGAGLSMHGDFHYKYKQGWIKISDHGSFDASLSGVSFSMTVKLGDAAGKPKLAGSGCSSGIGGVKIKFHGGASWLYNIFSHVIEGKVKGLLQSQMCKLVVAAVNTQANKQLAKLPMTVLVLKKFLLDYSLISNPTFDTKFLETMLKGEVFWNGARKECPFSPAPLPTTPDTSHMLYLWVSDYMGNSLAYSGFQHGFLQYNLTAKDLPPGNRSILNTTCSGFKCVGAFVPQIGKKYPNSQVLMRMHATAPPNVTIAGGLINMNFAGNVDLYAKTAGGKTPFLLTITVVLDAKVNASIVRQLVTGKITSTNLKLDVKNSTVGTVSPTALQLVMNGALKLFILPQLNAQGQKGLVLPVTDNIHFQNAQLSLLKGALLISTDLSYTPSTDEDDLQPDKATLPDTRRDRAMSFHVVGQKQPDFNQI